MNIMTEFALINSANNHQEEEEEDDSVDMQCGTRWEQTLTDRLLVTWLSGQLGKWAGQVA